MFRSTTKVLKSFVFQAFASLGIRVFEPGGRRFESVRAHFPIKNFFGTGSHHKEGNEQIEPPTDNETGSTTWPFSAKLDAAASPAAVRSEAEDERRSREQSVRAR
jgi:hypothetical protein